METKGRTAGEELKRYRVNALLTQQRLGELLGKEGRNAATMVQRWERDRKAISAKHMRRLHELLDIPYEAMIPHTTYKIADTCRSQKST